MTQLTVRASHPPIVHTASGRAVDLLHPDPASIDLEDIARGLSHVCRFAGQCRSFYSVAQHSVLCAQLVEPSLASSALLHDATEAYLGDVPRPVKRQCPEYQVIEDRLHLAIAARFGLPPDMPEPIQRADTQMLIAEWAVLMQGPCPIPGPPAPLVVTPLGPTDAMALFLDAARRAGLTDEKAIPCTP